ncbi:MAG: ABC transporter permease subunit [Micromonosporaceae bacterium]|nr:ABC transporter permease subunit [Micromonosporaceae bacterium]
MQHIVDNLPYLLDGLFVTLYVTALAWLVMMATAFALGFARYYGNRPARWSSGLVVGLFRGTSTFVMLFWAFYVLPQFGVTLTPIVTGVLVLGITEGCYLAEGVRGSLASVTRGQAEAARVLGLSPWQTMARVVLPQALPTMIAPIGNFTIALLKFTSLLSFISVQDLTSRMQSLRYQVGDSIVLFGVLLVVYYLLSTALGWLFRYLERRASVRGTGRPPEAGHGAAAAPPVTEPTGGEVALR